LLLSLNINETDMNKKMGISHFAFKQWKSKNIFMSFGYNWSCPLHKKSLTKQCKLRLINF
jgi:hypothetical protein